ncbi:MAG: histone deacetylase [Bacteroidetes bacterium]|nr:histone deacetylase [Bacteroidota bacterium]
MELLFNRLFLKHNPDCTAEGSYRIKDFIDQPDTTVNGEKWISLVHTQEYINLIQKACKEKRYLAEVQLSNDSYEAACLAVGLAVKASETEGFAIVRPPGHHASRDKTHGLCLFNNIAIASQKLVNEGKRVFILDIDGHHGDGTQNIFYSSNKVLFASIHQINTFPYSGAVIETGTGEGVGYTLNLPLYSGNGDKEFLKKLNKIIPVALGFKPDIIGISVGFDGYYQDDILELNYTDRLYYEAAFQLKRAFRKKKLFAILEGGYHRNIRCLADSFIEGINNGSKPPPLVISEDISFG